jgi:hypothetical protein
MLLCLLSVAASSSSFRSGTIVRLPDAIMLCTSVQIIFPRSLARVSRSARMMALTKLLSNEALDLVDVVDLAKAADLVVVLHVLNATSSAILTLTNNQKELPCSCAIEVSTPSLKIFRLMPPKLDI